MNMVRHQEQEENKVSRAKGLKSLEKVHQMSILISFCFRLVWCIVFLLEVMPLDMVTPPATPLDIRPIKFNHLHTLLSPAIIVLEI